MKTRLLFVCLALIFPALRFSRSSPNRRKKNGRKKAKEYARNPANLKDFTEAKSKADNSVTLLNGQVKQLQSSLSDKNARVAELEDQIARMRSELTAAKTELAQLKGSACDQSDGLFKGVIFKVQVGAFKNKNLAKYFENKLPISEVKPKRP